MKLSTYLFLDGRAGEALDFYAAALGATVEASMRFSDSPDPVPAEYLPPSGPDSIMHASLLVDGQRLMLSDGACPGVEDGRHAGLGGFSLTAAYAAESDARRVFNALADGGEVLMALGPTFFSPSYGQLVDRFGVQWMVMVEPAAA